MEDYIEDDFIEEEERSSNRRPFLLAVGALVTLFILMGICTAVFLVQNRAAQDQATERAAIETRNAETLAANAATAVAATAVAEAAPTNTPVPTEAPTQTAEPATPTSTPVVEETTDAEAVIGTDEGTADGEASDGDGTTGENSETENAEATNNDDDSAAAATPISSLNETGSSDGTSEALPQTGFDTWGIVLAALGLIGLLIFARRLRTSS
jgi:LPXTG-motif cell wall-anchored protein